MKTLEEIEQFLVGAVATRCKREPASVDREADLADYGLDSLEAVKLAGDLEGFLGARVAVEVFFQNATIAAVARAVSPKAQ